jgi:ABC-type uncharacterized transport system substrate-binding protein
MKQIAMKAGRPLLMAAAYAAPFLIAFGPAIGALCLQRDPEIKQEFEPVLNDSRPWRIGYYQGGSFSDYPRHLRAFAEGLASFGWLELGDAREWEKLETARAIWRHLAHEAQSEWVEFREEDFWSAEWEPDQRELLRKELLNRLNADDGFDLMLAMGTWAGLDLANNRHETPVIALAASDPVRAGIIESAESSGYEHVHALVDPDKYTRQIRLFHRLVGFKRLGLVYEDTPEGRTWSNVDVIREAAERRGFELIERHVTDTGIEPDAAARELRSAYEQLAPKIDALWLSTLMGEDARYMPWVLEPLLQEDVATWSQLGVEQVRRGVLMGVAEKDLHETGLRYAHAAASIFHGVQPGNLPQVFEEEKELTLNLETARRIGYRPPPALAEAADPVFHSIEGLNGAAELAAGGEPIMRNTVR